MLDHIKDIEGLEVMDIDLANTDNSRYESSDYWKSVLYSVKINERELEDLKKTRNEVVSKYDEVIARKKQTVDGIKDHIVNCLPRSPFKTKTGGYSFVLYPHIGEIRLSKEEESIIVPEQSKTYFIDLGLVSLDPKFSKSMFNKKYIPKDGKVLDIQSGEELNPQDIGVLITTKRKLTIK